MCSFSAGCTIDSQNSVTTKVLGTLKEVSKKVIGYRMLQVQSLLFPFVLRGFKHRDGLEKLKYNNYLRYFHSGSRDFNAAMAAPPVRRGRAAFPRKRAPTQPSPPKYLTSIRITVVEEGRGSFRSFAVGCSEEEVVCALRKFR